MDNGKQPQSVFAKVNFPVFWGSIIVCLLFYGPMVIFQEQAQTIVNAAFSFSTRTTDWIWEVVVLGCLVFCAWLALSKYGKVKLGGPDDKPEFSTFTWIAMMFCGGSGAGLVYWALVEPLWYVAFPPFGIEAMTAESAQWALAYGVFHWGFSAWATFAVPAIAFGYMYYVRKKPFLYPSYACRGVLGSWVDGWAGKLIDAIVIIGMVGGMATGLGFVIPMLSKIAADYFGIADTIGLQMIVSVVFLCIYGWSCYNGLKGGIAKLADANMYLSLALLAFVMIVGPTAFLLSFFTDNMGVLINNFGRMSLYTDPIAKSGFPQDWTTFYWAWWLAWAMYVGLFVARISKGRTIRSVIANCIFSATGACMLFFMIFGGYQIDLIFNQGVDLIGILKESGGPAVTSAFLQTLPFKGIIIPLFIFIMFISQATGVDAASFTMANMSCIEVQDGVEPPKWSRVAWALLLFFATTGLLLVGGMNAVKLSSVLTAIPVLFLLIILAISTVKWLREDFGYDEPLTTTKYNVAVNEKGKAAYTDGNSQTKGL